MCDDERKKQPTAELVALNFNKVFPNVPFDWLKKVNRMLGMFRGSGDMVTHWRPKSGIPKTEWNVLQDAVIQEMSPVQD